MENDRNVAKKYRTEKKITFSLFNFIFHLKLWHRATEENIAFSHFMLCRNATTYLRYKLTHSTTECSNYTY